HAFGELVEVALQQLLAQLVHELFEALAGSVVHEVVVLEHLHATGEIGRHLVELLTALLRELFDDLLATAVTRLLRLVDAALDAGAFLVDDLAGLLGGGGVPAAEVAPLQLLAAALSQPLEHLAQSHELLVVAVTEPLLEHPAQRRVQVAVVEEVVRHLLEQRVGVEIEPGLAAVPPRVLEPARISPPEPHAPILWALSPPAPRLPIRRRSPPQSTRAPSSPPCRDLGRRGRARGRLRLGPTRWQPP